MVPIIVLFDCRDGRRASGVSLRWGTGHGEAFAGPLVEGAVVDGDVGVAGDEMGQGVGGGGDAAAAVGDDALVLGLVLELLGQDVIRQEGRHLGHQVEAGAQDGALDMLPVKPFLGQGIDGAGSAVADGGQDFLFAGKAIGPNLTHILGRFILVAALRDFTAGCLPGR